MAVESQQITMQPLPNTTPESANNLPPKPLHRACDCCRKRKVKCDGREPCGPCKKASITCAYLQPPKKKGPKGLRSERVLQMLRRPEGNTQNGPTSNINPQTNGAFGNWAWNAQHINGGDIPYAQSATSRQESVSYPPHAKVPPQQNYFPQPIPRSVPASYQQPSFTSQPMQYASEPQSQPQSWSAQPESLAASSPITSAFSPAASDALPQRLPAQCFRPYMDLFFNHMYSIMPVIDQRTYLDPTLYTNSNLWSSENYCFFCAICAATIVQLDASIPQPASLYPNKRMDDLFKDECIRERKTYDYIENTSRLGVMTCFFLFAYYGNHEIHTNAWFFLQESITHAENLNMENEAMYNKLDPVEAQWWKRLYWLLFVTERAYAMQRFKRTRLHAKNMALPVVFDWEDSQTLNGFVNLARLFSAVDEQFVEAWRGSRKQSVVQVEWLAKTQKSLDEAGIHALNDLSESSRMDISVTKEWLHVLAWQMGVMNGLMFNAEGGNTGAMRLDYPIELAKKVVELLNSGSDTLALDSHGIGMEQKLYDIGVCLADVLRCMGGDTSSTFQEGKQYLHTISQKLSSIRGKESRYLKPLMAKMQGLMGYDLSNITLPLPSDPISNFPGSPHLSNGYFATTPRLSMVDSMNMLRSLSMTGSLSSPGLIGALEDWNQRRESGRVYDEAETADAMDSWMMNGVDTQVD